MAAHKSEKKAIQQKRRPTTAASYKRPTSWIDDPELRDENDPEYKEEMFETFKFMGWKPEDLTTDKKAAAEYAEWLKQRKD